MCLDCGSKLDTCRAGDPKPFHTMAMNPTTLDVWVTESTQLHLIQQQPRCRPSEECIISLLCHRPGFGLDLRLVVFMMLPPTSQSICLSDRTKRWAKDERQKTHFLHYSTILAIHVLCCKRQYLSIVLVNFMLTCGVPAFCHWNPVTGIAIESNTKTSKH